MRIALELSERNVTPRNLPDLRKRAMKRIQQNQNTNKRIYDRRRKDRENTR